MRATCTTKYNNEPYTLFDEIDIVKVIKIGRLRFLGHFCRMQKLDPYRMLILLEPEGPRRLRKTQIEVT